MSTRVNLGFLPRVPRDFEARRLAHFFGWNQEGDVYEWLKQKLEEGQQAINLVTRWEEDGQAFK